MKKIIILMAGIILVAIQASFIRALIYPFNQINIFLIIIILTVIFNKFSWSTFLSFTAMVFGIISYGKFGVEALSFMTISITLNFLLRSIFTHTSFFSVVLLGLIAFFLNFLLNYIFTWLFFFIKIQTAGFQQLKLIDMAMAAFYNVLLLTLLFVLIGRKMKSKYA